MAPIKPYDPRQFLSKSNASLGCIRCEKYGVYHPEPHLYPVPDTAEVTT